VRRDEHRALAALFGMVHAVRSDKIATADRLQHADSQARDPDSDMPGWVARRMLVGLVEGILIDQGGGRTVWRNTKSISEFRDAGELWRHALCNRSSRHITPSSQASSSSSYLPVWQPNDLSHAPRRLNLAYSQLERREVRVQLHQVLIIQ
jgi:hypothetical protein